MTFIYLCFCLTSVESVIFICFKRANWTMMVQGLTDGDCVRL